MQWITTQHNATQQIQHNSDTMNCNAMQRNKTDTTQPIATQCNTTQHNGLQHNTTQYNGTQRNATQQTQHNTPHLNTTTQHNHAHHAKQTGWGNVDLDQKLHRKKKQSKNAAGISVYKSTQNPLRSCISRGLLNGSLWYVFTLCQFNLGLARFQTGLAFLQVKNSNQNRTR